MTAARIIIVGDAISRGSNRDPGGALPATIRPSWRYWLWKVLREKGRDADFVGPQTYPDFPDPPWTFDQGNCCYGGNTTTGWMADKVRTVRAADTGDIAPQIALVLLGTEDCYAQVPVDTSMSHLKDIVTELRAWHRDRYGGAAGLDVVIAKLPPTTDGANGAYRTKTRIVPFNEGIVAKIAPMTTAAEQVIVVDCHTGWQPTYSDSTGLKPSEAGEQFIAQKFAAALDPLLAGVGPVVPEIPPGGSEPEWSSDTVRAEFSVSRREGTGPLEVQFTDKSVCDRKRMGRAVVVLPELDPEYAQKILDMIPAHLFDMPQIPAVEGSSWSMATRTTTAGTVTIPWPAAQRTVVLSKRSRPGAEWDGVGATATVYPDRKVSCPVTDAHITAGDYESPAQVLLHELLHTIPDLESSDDMRVSEGFRGWLAEHPSQAGNDFLADPDGYPANATILGIYYEYLVERYLNHPTLWSREVEYLWSFGDGHGSSIRSPTHSYSVPGTYPVTLTVTAPWGTDVSETTTITVHAGTVPPVASFGVSVNEGDAPLGVQFTDHSTGGTPLTWLWDFGDGHTATEPNPTHMYTAPGIYSPSLTVANEGGEDTIELPYLITVSRAPQPAPAIHELGAAGYLDLLDLLAGAFQYIELQDEAGARAVGAGRIAAGGRASWLVDDENMLATLRVRVYGSDMPTLPYRISGVAFYEHETGGEPLTAERFGGAAADWPFFTLPTDTLDVDVIVNIIAESVVPRLTNLVLENVSGECGTAMIARFRVVNVTPGWHVELVSVPDTVVAGTVARIVVRVVRDTV